MKIAGCILLVLGAIAFLVALAIGVFALWCLTIPADNAGEAFVAVATIAGIVFGVSLVLLVPGFVLWLAGRKR